MKQKDSSMSASPCLALDSIRSDIPVPGGLGSESRARRRPRINEALRLMQPGQSCLVNKIDRGGMYSRALVLGIRIVTRKEGEDLYRVWKLPG
jgi:hypothetical protein